jgi:hypothetical protein
MPAIGLLKGEVDRRIDDAVTCLVTMRQQVQDIYVARPWREIKCRSGLAAARPQLNPHRAPSVH